MKETRSAAREPCVTRVPKRRPGAHIPRALCAVFQWIAGVKQRYVIVAVACLIAASTIMTVRPAAREGVAIRDRAIEALPGLADTIRQSPPGVAAVLLHYAQGQHRVALDVAEAALLKYPKMAREVLPVYGDRPAFLAILTRYGTSIFPPIDYFMGHRVRSVEAMAYAARKIHAARKGFHDATATLEKVLGFGPSDHRATRMSADMHGSGETRGGGALVDHRRGRTAARESPDRNHRGQAADHETHEMHLTPAQRGEFAIRFINRQGHDFLGQFAVGRNGQVVWLQSERILQDLNTFFAGGIRTLDKRYRTGQPVTLNDAGWATADVLGAAGGLKLFSAAARGGRLDESFGGVARSAETVEPSTRTAGAATRLRAVARHGAPGDQLVGAGRLGAWVLRRARYAKWPAVVGTVYLMVRHPSVISGMLVRVAHVVGLPAGLVEYLGWFLLVLPLLYLGSWGLKYGIGPLVFALRLTIKSLLRIQRALA